MPGRKVTFDAPKSQREVRIGGTTTLDRRCPFCGASCTGAGGYRLAANVESENGENHENRQPLTLKGGGFTFSHMPHGPMPDWVTVKEASRLGDIPEKTLYRWIKAQDRTAFPVRIRIEHGRTKYRIHAVDFVKWLREVEVA